jgi:hypothetical protein
MDPKIMPITPSGMKQSETIIAQPVCDSICFNETGGVKWDAISVWFSGEGLVISSEVSTSCVEDSSSEEGSGVGGRSGTWFTVPQS